MNQPCAFSARMNNGIFICLRRNVASSFRVTLSLYSTMGSPQPEFVSKSGLSFTEERYFGERPAKAPSMIKGLKCFPQEERLNELGPVESVLEVDLVKMPKCLKGACKENRARLYMLVSSASTGYNEQRLKQRKLYLSIKITHLAVDVLRHWNMLSLRVVEFPFLEIFIIQKNMFVGSHI